MESEKLSREVILAALAKLDEMLRERGVIGELCVYGGAAMVLAFDAREATRDVDGVFVPKGEVLDCAKLVATEMELGDDWLNDGVKVFLSPKGEATSEGMPVFDNLRLQRPTTTYLLAMKCMASRVRGYDHPGDRRDVEFLLKELGLRDSAAVCGLIESFFPEQLVPAKVRFFVEEIVSEIEE